MTSSTPSIWIHLPDEKLLINANRWFVPSAQHNTVDWNVRAFIQRTSCFARAYKIEAINHTFHRAISRCQPAAVPQIE